MTIDQGQSKTDLGDPVGVVPAIISSIIDNAVDRKALVGPLPHSLAALDFKNQSKTCLDTLASKLESLLSGIVYHTELGADVKEELIGRVKKSSQELNSYQQLLDVFLSTLSCTCKHISALLLPSLSKKNGTAASETTIEMASETTIEMASETSSELPPIIPAQNLPPPPQSLQRIRESLESINPSASSLSLSNHKKKIINLSPQSSHSAIHALSDASIAVATAHHDSDIFASEILMKLSATKVSPPTKGTRNRRHKNDMARTKTTYQKKLFLKEQQMKKKKAEKLIFKDVQGNAVPLGRFTPAPVGRPKKLNSIQQSSADDPFYVPNNPGDETSSVTAGGSPPALSSLDLNLNLKGENMYETNPLESPDSPGDSGSPKQGSQSPSRLQNPLIDASFIRKKRRGKLPEGATDILKKWLFDHWWHPYPSEIEKRSLATRTLLSLSQINNWFTNARRRILPKEKPEPLILPSPSGNNSVSALGNPDSTTPVTMIKSPYKHSILPPQAAAAMAGAGASAGGGTPTNISFSNNVIVSGQASMTTSLPMQSPMSLCPQPVVSDQSSPQLNLLANEGIDTQYKYTDTTQSNYTTTTTSSSSSSSKPSHSTPTPVGVEAATSPSPARNFLAKNVFDIHPAQIQNAQMNRNS